MRNAFLSHSERVSSLYPSALIVAPFLSFFLSFTLYHPSGYNSVTNIDVSRVVIDQMIDRYKDKPTLQWQQMNVTALDFPDETFDVVVAKATMDAVLCGEGSTANVAKFCSEVSRVLKPTGCFFIVSYGVPDNRLNYLEKEIGDIIIQNGMSGGI